MGKVKPGERAAVVQGQEKALSSDLHLKRSFCRAARAEKRDPSEGNFNDLGRADGPNHTGSFGGSGRRHQTRGMF